MLKAGLNHLNTLPTVAPSTSNCAVSSAVSQKFLLWHPKPRPNHWISREKTKALKRIKDEVIADDIPGEVDDFDKKARIPVKVIFGDQSEKLVSLRLLFLFMAICIALRFDSIWLIWLLLFWLLLLLLLLFLLLTLLAITPTALMTVSKKDMNPNVLNPPPPRSSWQTRSNEATLSVGKKTMRPPSITI